MLLPIVALLGLAGCGADSDIGTDNEVYQKKQTDISSVATEPSSLRKFALVASGNIDVKASLVTDGPLADVYSHGDITAPTRSLDISGKITAKNLDNLDGAVKRSFDYKGNIDSATFSKVRALKVSEYLNSNSLTEYVHLKSDGSMELVSVDTVTDEKYQQYQEYFSFYRNAWHVEGFNVEIDRPLKVDGDLVIDSDSTFIAGSLMVEGSLQASGELNINTGTPFDVALIVNNNTSVNKLVTIGRLHLSGDFEARSDVNIVGNAEIDGNVTLYASVKINFLDNVFKAALFDMQQAMIEPQEIETTDPETGETIINETEQSTESSAMLVHSQLFSDVKGNNSVVMFTFVEGDYLLNENAIFALIKADKVDDFKFRTYLYGASMQYGAQLQVSNELSDYYANKLAIIESLKTQGSSEVKITESLDVAPSTLYHTFEADGVAETKLVYKLGMASDDEIILTTEARAELIEALDNPATDEEVQAQLEVESDTTEPSAASAETELTDVEEELKQEADGEMAQAEAETDRGLDNDALKAESEQDRIQEWVENQELVVEEVIVDAEEVVVDSENATQQRGWFKKLVKKVKKVLKKITFTDCKKKTTNRYIAGVTSSRSFANDSWNSNISLRHSGRERCGPISAAMIVNYHTLREKGAPIWRVNYGDNVRFDSSNDNPLVEYFAGKFHTSDSDGTPWYKYYSSVPYYTTKKIKKEAGVWSYSWSSPTTVFNRDYQHKLVRHYVKQNKPMIFSAWQSHGKIDGRYIKDHSMPVIGYKREYYSGKCWKKVMPEKKWILVDTTWGVEGQVGNRRGFVRFDSRSNYFKLGTMTYIHTRG